MGNDFNSRERQEKIPPDKLPFDLGAEFGEILDAELRSRGVYYLAVRRDKCNMEVYVVMANAPAISDKARAYGQVLPNHPDLLVYDLNEPGSGRHIIDFEVCRYLTKRHLPRVENDDSIYVHALYGAEEHPDYFGLYPVPLYTPRGRTVRHKMIINGVYWLETERCEEMLAVCYPIWNADITIPEHNLGEQLEYDRMQGISNTLGYMFFPKLGSAIALYELSLVHKEIAAGGVVDMPALMNAICEFYPEYTALHNEQEAGYENGDIISSTPGAGTEFIGF